MDPSVVKLTADFQRLAGDTVSLTEAYTKLLASFDDLIKENERLQRDLDHVQQAYRDDIREAGMEYAALSREVDRLNIDRDRLNW